MGVDVLALGFEAADPTGYGRLVERNGRLIAIREHKDASAEERASRLCNAGPIACRGGEALSLLAAVEPANAQNEYYLTDIVEIANAQGLTAKALLAKEKEVMGVNDRAQLAAAEAALQDRLRRRAMAAGATLTAPETVFLSFDARIGRDVLIEPHVVIGPGCSIEDGAVIRAFSHLEGARVAGGAIIGPFARLRSGADIAVNAKIGNFVEIKQSAIEEGAKVNHLTYIGDARVGAKANIGAGTITCNCRLRQAQDRHRRRRPHRLELRPRRAGDDRDGALYRLGLGDHQVGRSRRARSRARPPGGQGRLGARRSGTGTRKGDGR